jgi:formamidopyrimidine-DNA glycosylase
LAKAEIHRIAAGILDSWPSETTAWPAQPPLRNPAPPFPAPSSPMPELPEVETMRRGLEPLLEARLDDLACPRSKLRPITMEPSAAALRKQLRGHRVVSIERFGKRVVLRFDGDRLLVFEPRMTGLLLMADPPNRTHLRLVADFASGDRTLQMLFWDQRGLGTVRLMTDAEARRRFAEDRLGPDALLVDGPLLRQRLAHRRIAIKVGLLDQRALAGIGNLYASEILHVAGIDPRVACHRLTRPQWQAIANATQQVLREAIEHEGSTLSDGTYRNTLNEAGGYQNHHRVYDRQGQPCARCGSSTIHRIVQAQRSTYFCPHCQTRTVPRGQRSSPSR